MLNWWFEAMAGTSAIAVIAIATTTQREDKPVADFYSDQHADMVFRLLIVSYPHR